MLFNSIEFLFAFLPFVLIVFLWLRRFGNARLLMGWLTASSLFFYGWWNPKYLVLLVLSCTVNYSFGLLMSRFRTARSTLLLAGVLFNLLLLGYFKYANFFVDSINALTPLDFNFEHIVLPLAISFYTFVQITYLVDTSKGQTEPVGWLEYAVFVTFFPQLIAGPIVHHSDMATQYKELAKPRDTVRQLMIGGSIFIIGLFKKVVIADGFAEYASPVFQLAAQDQAITALDAITGIFSYAFQLYFDFSGYSDMAIGLACMFGIKLPVNFFSPFRAQSISELWSTWHATLTRFLRDYIYTPLGGFMVSRPRQRFNLFATMFLGGVWHGAGWTFVLYGLCHGTYVVVNQWWRANISGPHGWTTNGYYRSAMQVLTFLVCALTLVIFRADSVAAAGRIYGGLINFNSTLAGAGLQESMLEYGLTYGLLLVALIACWVLPNTYQLFKSYDVVVETPAVGRTAVLDFKWEPNGIWAVCLAALTSACLINLYKPSSFVYFQF